MLFNLSEAGYFTNTFPGFEVGYYQLIIIKILFKESLISCNRRGCGYVDKSLRWIRIMIESRLYPGESCSCPHITCNAGQCFVHKDLWSEYE